MSRVSFQELRDVSGIFALPGGVSEDKDVGIEASKDNRETESS